MNPYRTLLLRVIVPFSNDPNRCVHLMAARVLYERKDRSVVWRFGSRARFLRHFESLPDIEHLLSMDLAASAAGCAPVLAQDTLLFRLAA